MSRKENLGGKINNIKMINANTFSICAVNPETGEAGVAVASYCLSVGGLVPYVEPGVGAIATQCFINPLYGTRGLEMLRRGREPEEILSILTGEDLTITDDTPEVRSHYEKENMTREDEDYSVNPETGKRTWFTSRMRQVGIVSMAGDAAVHTGACASSWAGHVVGKGFCCQGNMLAGESVIADMVESFERERTNSEKLVAPLYAALAAGEKAGGDKRGKLAAAVTVAQPGSHWTGNGIYCNIRVDSHPAAVAELGAILKKHDFV